MDTYTKKKVLIILTGGTISGNVAVKEGKENIYSQPDDFMSVIGNAVEILKRDWGIEVEPQIAELYNVDSSNMKPENWTGIAQKIKDTYDEFDAYIVLHGTNTMAYTASALSFALENINKPVILTGSQIPLGYLGSDAINNLVNALRVALWKYHSIKGVLVVFGSVVITGTRVKKSSDYDYDPFRSFQSGSLGQIGRFIRINELALVKHTSYLSKSKPLALNQNELSVISDFETSSIVSLTEFPGMSAGLLKSLVENNGIKAFIFRAFGAGDPSQTLMEAFEYLKDKQIPIVVTTQLPNGVANFQVNESGKFLKDNDLAIPAFDMSIEAITTKLSWLLGQKMNYEQIKMKMLEDLHGEINVENEMI